MEALHLSEVALGEAFNLRSQALGKRGSHLQITHLVFWNVQFGKKK